MCQVYKGLDVLEKRKMLTCSQAENLFDAYLDDELSESLRTELHAHRLRCPRCKHQLALMEACRDVIKADPDPAKPLLSEDFTERVLSAWKRPEAAPVRRFPLRRVALFTVPASAAAAVLALVMLLPWQITRPKAVEGYRDTAIVAKPANVVQPVAADAGEGGLAEYLLRPLLTSWHRTLLGMSQSTGETVEWLTNAGAMALEQANQLLETPPGQEPQDAPTSPAINPEEPCPDAVPPYPELWDPTGQPPESTGEDAQVII